MNDNMLDNYETLLKEFLDHKITVERFQEIYLNKFKSETQVDEVLFEVLDELFGDVDSFTQDPDLIAKDSGFYLDEEGLRRKARLAVARLSALKT